MGVIYVLPNETLCQLIYFSSNICAYVVQLSFVEKANIASVTAMMSSYIPIA